MILRCMTVITITTFVECMKHNAHISNFNHHLDSIGTMNFILNQLQYISIVIVQVFNVLNGYSSVIHVVKSGTIMTMTVTFAYEIGFLDGVSDDAVFTVIIFTKSGSVLISTDALALEFDDNKYRSRQVIEFDPSSNENNNVTASFVVASFNAIVALLSVPICMIFLIKGGIKTHLFDVELIVYLYILMVVYVLLIQSGINVNIMEVFFQNIFLSWIIWQINYYYDQILLIQVIAAVIILIWTLFEGINGYSILFTGKVYLITVNSNAETIIYDDLSNISLRYAIAGGIVKFVRNIICCQSGTTNFIPCGDDKEGGDGTLFALVAVEFNDANVEGKREEKSVVVLAPTLGSKFDNIFESEYNRLDYYPVDKSDNYLELKFRHETFINHGIAVDECNTDSTDYLETSGEDGSLAAELESIVWTEGKPFFEHSMFSDMTDSELTNTLNRDTNEYNEEDVNNFDTTATRRRRRLFNWISVTNGALTFASGFIDLTNYDIGIQDEGNCPSTAVFASTAQFEINYNTYQGNNRDCLIKFSEQYAMDCGFVGINSCNIANNDGAIGTVVAGTLYENGNDEHFNVRSSETNIIVPCDDYEAAKIVSPNTAIHFTMNIRT